MLAGTWLLMLWRGLKECAGEWEGKERAGQAGVESWLPTLLCCQEHFCVCVCSWALCFSSCLLSMSQMLALWRVAPQKAGLPRPGDPPEVPAPPECWGIVLQASCGRQRGACSACWQCRTQFPCSGKPQCPQGQSISAAPQHTDQCCSGHASRT